MAAPYKLTFEEQLRHIIDNKTKPPGALGRLEEIALQIGLIQQITNPAIQHPHIVVFAGDHGIAKTGLVNAYPQEVTAQMVLNFAQGGAAINVFCRQNKLTLKVVDAGVNFDFTSMPVKVINAKIGFGTKNYLNEPAMTIVEAEQAIEKGRSIVRQLAADGCNCIGFGEMGIGNTSSATLLLSAITGLPVVEFTGRGAGLNDDQLQKKIDTLQQVYEKHALNTLGQQPIELLSKVGGFEIAMMAGAYLEAVHLKMIVLVDGFIATSALLVANEIFRLTKQPSAIPGWTTLIDHCIFAHTSQEAGHEKILRHLGVTPLLHLAMRLGEGTGAALAMPMVQAAVNFLNEMASFESAGVSNKE
ncbi:nicotinate-nucleotide--dimethylbenzimidazole phosphoribosyltransferase [Niastella yeongjuensis]|uniref:Nicotinate-nucleotide--dimethylbenzimidazole phosphoribosyltransferase n=1 Tax=Niastella yeongjuensis TaxID=354355 RepID=A0A1V9EXQ4_9BACT|nr:nicotinate-nucleotide--dimethylbenzimidazole phosphoribosyltransferase [Niastella yeongjuensis]OQP50889.1 nicotinate-nucleotide--dimethylbenzimidazole phosphoribosyltransferase [Niastella yeongjuensis]SEN13022.1 nicotinate-nucleotide-dimethylbenzimidazole phosphoribosyltransferase [Niastella yeongjuensis]